MNTTYFMYSELGDVPIWRQISNCKNSTCHNLHGDVSMCTDNDPFKIYLLSQLYLLLLNSISGRCADVPIFKYMYQ